jgi:two-component system cell cycle sensor histidine kinase PleC
MSPDTSTCIDLTDFDDAAASSLSLAGHQDLPGLSENLGLMSHELRTPLNAVLGFSDILRSEAFGPLGAEAYVEDANDIHESGYALLTMLDRVSLLVRLEAGQLKPECYDIAVADIVDDALELSSGVRERVWIREPAYKLAVKADARLLAAALHYLVENAVAASPPEKLVSIFWRRQPDRRLAIIVQDCGEGIPAHQLAAIRSPFVKLERRNTFDPASAGLGLPLAIHLAGLFSGNIDIRSEEGVGTTCHLVLPACRVRVAV